MLEQRLDVLRKHATSQLPFHMAIEAHLTHDTNIRFDSDCLLLRPDYLAIDLWSNLSISLPTPQKKKTEFN